MASAGPAKPSGRGGRAGRGGRGGKKGLSPAQRRIKSIQSAYKLNMEDCLGHIKVVNDEEGTVETKIDERAAMENPVLVAMDEEDMNKIYFLMMGLYGPEGAFGGAEFLGYLSLPPNFPYDPPNFGFHTTSGVYTPNADTPCVSIGKYHKNESSGVQGFSAALGFMGFINAIWGTFADPKSLGGGINVEMHNGPREWRKFAAESVAANEAKYPKIMRLFADIYPDLEKRRDHFRQEWLEQKKRDEEWAEQAEQAAK